MEIAPVYELFSKGQGEGWEFKSLLLDAMYTPLSTLSYNSDEEVKKKEKRLDLSKT